MENLIIAIIKKCVKEEGWNEPTISKLEIMAIHDIVECNCEIIVDEKSINISIILDADEIEIILVADYNVDISWPGDWDLSDRVYDEIIKFRQHRYLKSIKLGR